MRSLWIVIKEVVKAKLGPKGDDLYYYPEVPAVIEYEFVNEQGDRVYSTYSQYEARNWLLGLPDKYWGRLELITFNQTTMKYEVFIDGDIIDRLLKQGEEAAL